MTAAEKVSIRLHLNYLAQKDTVAFIRSTFAF